MRLTAVASVLGGEGSRRRQRSANNRLIHGKMSGNMQHANYYHHPLGVLSLCMAAVIVLVVDVSVAQVSIPRLLASTVAPSVSCTPNFYGTGTCTSHNNREECGKRGLLQRWSDLMDRSKDGYVLLPMFKLTRNDLCG